MTTNSILKDLIKHSPKAEAVDVTDSYPIVNDFYL